MDHLAKRPRVIWVTQVVLLSIASLLIFAVVRTVTAISELADYYGIPRNFVISRVAWDMAEYGVLSVVALLACWGLVKRRKYGLYLSYLLFALVFAAFAYGFIYEVLRFPGLAVLTFYPLRLAALLISPFVCFALISLAIALVVNRNVRTFFSPSNPDRETPPPPPPTFDD